jgi:hypothetical protein
VLAHYGVVALPCRVRDPDRKGKVESGIGHAQRTPLKGLRFETLDAAQAYLDRWEAAGPTRASMARRSGRSRDVCRGAAALAAAAARALSLLPPRPAYVVHLDGCVEVEAAYYSVPPGWIGRQVVVQWDDLHVRVLDPKTSGLLREHLRTRRGAPSRRRRGSPLAHADEDAGAARRRAQSWAIHRRRV